MAYSYKKYLITAMISNIFIHILCATTFIMFYKKKIPECSSYE